MSDDPDHPYRYITELEAEVDRLRAEKTDLLKKRNENEMQKMIDYWGKRAEKAEADLDERRKVYYGDIIIMTGEIEQMCGEIERQQADIDKLLDERQGWLDEIERLKAALKPFALALDTGDEPPPEAWAEARRALAGKT